MSDADTLSRLSAMLRARRDADPADSYVAALRQRGLDHVLKKVGEEATETVIAAKTADRRQLVYETADLWFHTLVMLELFDLGAMDILEELERRMGTSGIAEKAARKTST